VERKGKGDVTMLSIIRLENTAKVTRGILTLQGRIIALTLENPWKNNQPDISCIPTGVYPVQRYQAQRDWLQKYNPVLKVLNVPGRTGILFHPGNKVEHTEGCILVGLALGTESEPSIVQSVQAFRRLQNLVEALLGGGKLGYLHVIRMEV